MKVVRAVAAGLDRSHAALADHFDDLRPTVAGAIVQQRLGPVRVSAPSACLRVANLAVALMPGEGR